MMVSLSRGKRYTSPLKRNLCSHCQGKSAHGEFTGLHNLPVRVNEEINEWLHRHCKCKGQEKTITAPDTTSGLLYMPELLENLDNVTEQRKRLLRCVNLEGLSKDELKTLRGELQRVKLEHQDRKSRLTSSPDGNSIRSGAPRRPTVGDGAEPGSNADKAALMAALTLSHVSHYQQALEIHAERERGRLGRVHARHQADHASLPTLIGRLNISEAQIREVMQGLEQKVANTVIPDSQDKGAGQLEIARAILLGQPHNRKHYRTATVSALRKLGATLPDEFSLAGLAASLAWTNY